MCGITGFLETTHSTSSEKQAQLIQKMSDAIQHRGPDDSGAWTEAESGIALGFRRLAILDLSPTGHQPMLSADGRYVIIFNGEIYNFARLRQELLGLGHSFRGTSDTEIILAAVCQWGLKETIQRLNGMFAFALWDRQARALHLVRDRLGIKPMYYGWVGKTLLFGSELKALRAHPDFHGEIDRDALAAFLRFSYIPAPFSIYRGIKKLPPACLLTIEASATPGAETPVPYWSVRETAQNGLDQPFTGGDEEAIETLEGHLTRSIGERMMADVPLGAFLSGGLDSSTVVALMQKQSSRPVRTFTIGFSEAGFNEAPHAKAVAAHLGTDHTELYLSPAEAQAVIPHLPQLYDEPFADPSQIPTFLVSQLARQHVTVSLSGDGGDELFGGYNRYLWVERLWQRGAILPPLARKTLAGGLNLLSRPSASRLFRAAAPNLPNPADKAKKLAQALTAAGPEAIYLDLVSHWKNPNDLLLDGREPLTPLTDPAFRLNSPSFVEQMMFIDQLTYLPEDVLAKVDRASMGTSLEARAPFLDDHETVALAWQLPLKMKIRDGQGKWILRQILYRHVPRALVDRPKMGFGVPIDAWLRGPLTGWAEALLDENRLQQEGFFRPAEIRRKWREHLSGAKNWQSELWNVLMFQAWNVSRN
jgi:asparagine synthase (glutamine-hydrolysing)